MMEDKENHMNNVWSLKLDNTVQLSNKYKCIPVMKTKPICWSKIKPYKVGQDDIQKQQLKAKHENFHDVIKLTLLLGQCVGLNPVLGILKENSTKLRFKFKHIKVSYSIALCLIQGTITCLSALRLFRNDLNYNIIAHVMFHAMTCITTIVFLNISRQWPALAQTAAVTEVDDPVKYKGLRFKCNMACFIVVILALTEHILSFVRYYAEIRDCFPNDKDIYRSYIERTFPWLFEVNTPYSLPLGIFLQLIITTSTINWHFSDVFIINISFYLTCRLDQINSRIIPARGKYLPTAFWRKMREDYNRVTQLVRDFDAVVSGVVFLSFASSLFFVCLQLFNTLRSGIKHGIPVEQCPNYPSGPMGGYERAVYFLFSLTVLLARSLGVSLIAAAVHSAALIPAPVLYAVPSPVYCVEVQRFLDELHGTVVALSGLKFFDVTRGVVLTVAGTIATYELVLLQFESSDLKSSVKSTLSLNITA